MKNLIITLLLIFGLTNDAYAIFGFLRNLFRSEPQCPTQSRQTKQCPEGSSQILDDTYPPRAVVISNSPYNTSNLSYQTPANFILEAIKAYRGSSISSIPLFVIPVSSRVRVDRIKELVRQGLTAANYTERQIDKLISKIVQANTPGYTWQQDYFESFYEPSSGEPVIRDFESYGKKFRTSRSSVEKIGDAISDRSCQSSTGRPLPTDPRTTGNGEMGGNLEGLPGGGCLYGDNLGDGLAQSICRDKKDHSQIFASWLEVGHVDEIIKITPGNKNPNVPPECNFTINAASPMKAIELLEANPTGRLLDPPPTGVSEAPYYNNRKDKLCEIYRNIPHTPSPSPTPPSQQPSDPGGARGVFNFILPTNTQAGFTTTGGPATGICSVDSIKNMTNQDFVNGVRNTPRLFELNELIERTMQENLEKIKTTISHRLPQCMPHIDVAHVPDFYYSPFPSSKIIEKNGVRELATNGDSISFFPSPTNGVFLNETMIYSDNEVPAFKGYLREQMRQRGNNARFVRTYEYSHMGQGNLHCSSHTIPFCRPRD